MWIRAPTEALLEPLPRLLEGEQGAAVCCSPLCGMINDGCSNADVMVAEVDGKLETVERCTCI